MTMRHTPAFLIVLSLSSPLFAASYGVTRTDDPVPDGCWRGDCSLREAVIAANANPGRDTIVLGAKVHVLTRAAIATLDERYGALWLREDVDVIGAGSSRTRVRWSPTLLSPNDSVFRFRNPALMAMEATVDGMTISHGRSQVGGCVEFATTASTFALSDVVIESCSASNGGALSLKSSLLSMDGVTLRYNSASAGGGALYATHYSTLLTEKFVVTGNRAVTNGGGLLFHRPAKVDPDGATWYDYGDSRVEDNRAGGNGGGVAVTGDVSLTMANSSIDSARYLRIQKNHADVEGGGVWRGPRLISTYSPGAFFGRVRMLGNDAVSGGGVGTTEFVQLQNVELGGNVASQRGGGLYLAGNGSATVHYTGIDGNTAAGEGGGVYAGCQSLGLQNVSLQRNTAPQGFAMSTAGYSALTHVTINAHSGPGNGAALRKRNDVACPGMPTTLLNSLIVDRCSAAAGGPLLSDGGNQYGPAAIACPATPGDDQRQLLASAFGLSIATFGGAFDISGWNDDGMPRPQRNFISGWCMSDDVRGLLRNDGACDSGAFEQQP
jgi:predicted outer membrane repeat protein